MTESMGSITDHALEHLAVGDRMITLTRRRLIRATRALKNKGEVPPGVDNPEVYLGACGGDFIAPEGVGFDDAFAENSVPWPTRRENCKPPNSVRFQELRANLKSRNDPILLPFPSVAKQMPEPALEKL